MSDYFNDLIQKYVDLSGHLSASYNLNNGLPWTNPLKIGIGSDQHIIDTTINRGLMMLLNNDYYLDAKETLISQQISGLYTNTNLLYDVLSSHINDQSVHGTNRITYNNYIISGTGIDVQSLQQYNNSIALKDYLVYLPITWSASKINQKISSIPHNLNGHTVVFMFVVPDTYDDSSNDFDGKYCFDVGNYCLQFSNFINGVVFVIGDFLHQTKINGKINFQKFTKKTEHQIEDPQKYDGIILKNFIQKLYKEIDNPESSQDIQAYHDNSSCASIDLNKIIIKGTALNSNYSIINFNEIKSKVYIKNLAFHSTLETITERGSETNIIDVSSALNFNVPSNDKFLIHWPINQFSNDLYLHQFQPIIGSSFKQYIQDRYNSPIYNLFNNYLNCINEGTNLISSFFYKDEYTTKVSSFKHMIKLISANLTTPISSEIKLLSSYVSIKPQLYLDDPTEYQDVEITGKYSLCKQIQQVSSSLIPQKTKTYLINSINEAFTATKKMNQTIPTFITNPKITVKANDAIKQVTEYQDNVKLFYSNISAVIYSQQFSEFLKQRVDLYISDPLSSCIKTIRNIASTEERSALFCNKYNIDGIFSSYDQILTMLNDDIILNLSDLDDDQLIKALSLRDNGKGTCISFNNINPYQFTQSQTSDSTIKTNYSNHSVDAVLLTSNLQDLSNYKNYFSFQDNQFIQYVGQILFSQKYYKWDDIHQKGIQFNPPSAWLPKTSDYKSSPMFDSTYDSTITFWTKINRKSSDKPLISFYSNDDFKCSIHCDSFKSIDKENSSSYKSKLSNGILFGNDMLTQVSGYIPLDDNSYPWIFWSIKIDKSSNKYYVQNKSIENLPNLKNKISLKVDAYIYSSDGKRFNVKKFELNQYPFNPNNGITTYMNNYIYLPMQESQLSGFNMKVGLSYQPNSNYYPLNTSNDQQMNKYFYNGYFRNLMLFKGHLTEIQEMNLFRLGILNSYDFPTQYQNQTMESLINSGKFFLGLVSIYDSSDINIINCDTKYNGNTYRV